jgi:hypothetical protein
MIIKKNLSLSETHVIGFLVTILDAPTDTRDGSSAFVWIPLLGLSMNANFSKVCFFSELLSTFEWKFHR